MTHTPEQSQLHLAFGWVTVPATAIAAFVFLGFIQIVRILPAKLYPFKLPNALPSAPL